MFIRYFTQGIKACKSPEGRNTLDLIVLNSPYCIRFIEIACQIQMENISRDGINTILENIVGFKHLSPI